MSGFNYSKWDKIELSDDESDCHPNIDKESWFRMKHRSRLEREEREDAEIKSMEQLNAQNQARLNVIRARLGVKQSGQQQSEDAEFEDLEALEGEAAELETEVRKRNKRIGEIKERRAWNIDNICKVVEEKTVVNTANKANSLKAEDFEPTGHTEAVLAEKSGAGASNSADPPSSSSSATTTTTTTSAATSKAAAVVPPPSAAVKSTTTSTSTATPVGPAASPAVAGREKFAVMSYNDFVIKHEAILETYSEIRSLEDSKDYLFRHCDILLHEHSQSYMLLSCLEDEMNGKHARMKLVCRQSQILSHITELAASLGRDPRDVVLPFFRRIEDREYFSGFEKAVSDFTERIEKRAVEKRREMDAEARRESRDEARRAYQQRKEEGLVPEDKPDPFEVLESLPTDLRDAFEMQDLEQLQLVLSRMSPADAKKYMKLCVDSGLWVPSQEANVFEDEGEEEGEAEN